MGFQVTMILLRKAQLIFDSINNCLHENWTWPILEYLNPGQIIRALLKPVKMSKRLSLILQIPTSFVLRYIQCMSYICNCVLMYLVFNTASL